MYRSFHNNGDCIDNPYYGPNGTSDFDFTRLLDHIFHQILLHSPLSQRVHGRRVSQRWLTMANTALAVGTKSVSTFQPFYSNMTPDHLQSFLPLVADCLQDLTVSNDLVQLLTLDRFSSITAFPALKEIHFTWTIIFDHDALFYVLDRSPKLKVLSAPIPSALPMPHDRHGQYAVEKLTVWGEDVTDARLVAFLDCFPDLTRICIRCKGYFTASCISWVMEKYGSKLHQFESFDDFERYSSPLPSPFGAVSGIQTCSNLQHLSLLRTGFVSDVLIGALAAGCHKLETLDICCSNEMTNGGLAMLAVLPNLTWLIINGRVILEPIAPSINMKSRHQFIPK